MVSNYHIKADYSRFKAKGYPVIHRRKVPFRPRLSLPYQFRGYVRRIYELDRALGGFVLSADDFGELVTDAYASNIHWSTALEGNTLTLGEVRDITASFFHGGLRESDDPQVREILNHLESMFVDDRFGVLWDAETVCSLHRMLMDGIGNTVPGTIRTTDVIVGDGRGTVFFKAAPHQDVRSELDHLLGWLSDSPFDGIVASTLFFHEFESIHPFDDGNGRTGRVLFQLHLRECGLGNCDLCRFEEELISDRATYYDLLSYTDATADYTPIVQYFIESLLISYQKAVYEFGSRDCMKDFDENTRNISMKAREAGRFTMADALSWTKLGAQSVRRKLNDLVDVGILRKEGKTRGLHYVFNDPFSDLRIASGPDETDDSPD